MKPSGSKIFHSMMTVTVFSAMTRTLGFIFKVFISRKFGAEAVGLYQIALSVILMILAFSASGIPPVLSRKVAELTAKGQNARASAMLTASIIICGGLSLLFIGLFLALKPLLPYIFSDRRCIPLFLTMLPALFSTSIYSSLRSYFWGRKQFSTFSLAELMEELFKLLFTMLLAAGIFAAVTGAMAIAVAIAVGDFVSLIILFLIFLKRGGRLKRPHGFSELVKQSLPLTATRGASNILNSLTAIIIPSRLVAAGLTVAEATAMFGRMTGMALPLLMAPTILTGALSVVLIPELASASAEKKQDEIARRVKSSILFCVVISGIFAIMYIPLGEPLVRFLFKDEIAGKLLSLAAVTIYPISLNQITSTVLNSLGHERRTFINYAAGAAVLLPSLIFLPKYIGIIGMAAGTGICFFITTLLNVLSIRKIIKGPILDLKKITAALLLAVPCVLIGMLSERFLSRWFTDFYRIVLITAVSVGLYSAAVLAFKIIDFKVVAFLKSLGRSGIDVLKIKKSSEKSTKKSFTQKLRAKKFGRAASKANKPAPNS
ncbi:MAG: polysaccharide biosynthesis C-terminal domain-containing protein [Christensenellales bacterium]|jgi:stage V sporulation protein B